MNRRKYSVHDVLSMIEDVPNLTSADIYISPPDNSNYSDEDSGDEDLGNINNLTRRQLEAEAEFQINTDSGRDAASATNIDNETLDTTMDEVDSAEMNSAPDYRILDVTQNVTLTEVTDLTEPSTSSRKRQRKPSLRVRESLEVENNNVTKKTRRSKKTLSTLVELPESDEPDATEIEDYLPVNKVVRGNKNKITRNWVQSDLEVPQLVPNQLINLANQYTTFDSTPASLFEIFLDDGVVGMIVDASNKYAGQKGNHSFNISPEELRLFFSVLFTSGYNPLLRRRMYWEHTDDVRNNAISNAMTRNRFDDIMRFLHVADNENLPTGDKFGKVRPLFSSLNAKFLAAFPQQHHQLAIDESMVPYYGRHSAKQFIRGKPIRFGYKVWSINTPLGYCIQLDPYQGAGGVTDVELGLGGSVVMKLIKDLPEAKYNLYFDNFFTNLRLIDALSAKNIGATGTVRANRVENCPLETVDKMKKTKRGEYVHLRERNKDLIVVRWNDNSVVTLASNCHGIVPLATAQLWSAAEKKRVEIPMPHLIKQYNINMGGVDRMDQNIGAYRISVRTRKWWWPLFAYLLDVSMQNAWLLYRLTPAYDVEPLDQLEFRRNICNLYYKRYHPQNRSSIGRPMGRAQPLSSRVPQEIRLDGLNHLLESSGTQRRCAVCRLKTRRQCNKCDVGLHVECFF